MFAATVHIFVLIRENFAAAYGYFAHRWLAVVVVAEDCAVYLFQLLHIFFNDYAVGKLYGIFYCVDKFLFVVCSLYSYARAEVGGLYNYRVT